jgi:hypothetical protein
VRLGLRLTTRQTADKSTDKGEGEPADASDRPANGDTGGLGKGNLTADKHAGMDTAEPGKGDPTEGTPDGDAGRLGTGGRTGGVLGKDDTPEPNKGDMTADGRAEETAAELGNGDVGEPAGGDTVELGKAGLTADTPNGAAAAEVGEEDRAPDAPGAAAAAEVGGEGPAADEPADGDTAALGTGDPAEDKVVDVDAATLDKAAAGTATAEKEDRTLSLPGPVKEPTGLGRGMAVLGVGTRRVRRWGTSAARLWQPGPGIREAADPGGRAFAMVTVLPSLLLIAWLLPGLVLLLVGRFLPAPMVLISVPVAVALTMLAARHIPGRWPVMDTKDRPAKSRGKPWAAWWGLGGTVAIAVVFAAWQIVVNSPQFIVSRDPGVYAQLAYWIADHGVLPIPASLAAFGGAHPGLSFASFGFASHGASVVPQLPAGLPIVLAAGMWVHGVTGASVMSPLLGALAVLAVGGLTGRLAGPQWAPAGAFLLALTVPEAYTSRSAFGEILAQALLFGGLCLVVDAFSSRKPVTLAVLGGLSIGFTVLAGTGLLLTLLPAIPVAGALLAGRRPQGIPLSAGLFAGVACGLAAAIGLDFPAVSSTTPSLGIIGVFAAGFLVLTAVGVTVGLVGPVRRRARTLLDRRPLCWLPEAAAVVVLAAAAGLAVRPYLQKVRGPASPYVAALQRLEGLPIDPGRLYAENSLYWVIWYLGVPALLLGIIGLAMITRQCVRALITWRDTSGAAQAWALPVAIIGWGVFAVLWRPDTVPDQPWASRQLVPLILPGLAVLAVWVAAWLIDRAHERGAGLMAVALATACFVVALAEPPAAITFGIALSRPANPATRTALSGLAFKRTGAGQVTAVERLCGAIPRHSSVLLLDKVAARAFAQVIRGTCDVPAGVVAGASPSQVDAIIGGIQRAGRHPALLATRASELAPYGASPSEIVNLATQQDAHLLTRPPTSTWPVHYVLWMSSPGGTVTGS